MKKIKNNPKIKKKMLKELWKYSQKQYNPKAPK